MADKTIHLIDKYGIGTILSRAWRVYRLHYRIFILYPLLINIWWFFSNVYLDLVKQNLNTPTLDEYIASPASLLLWLMGFYFAVAFNYVLSRAIYNKLIGSRYDYSAMWDFFKRSISRITKLSALIFTEFIVFIFIDAFLFVIILITSSFILRVPGVEGFAASGVHALVITILLMCLLVAIIIQVVLAIMHIVIASVEQITIKEVVLQSFKLFYNDFIRTLFLFISVFILWSLLVFYFNLPVMLYNSAKTYLLGAASITNIDIIIVRIWGLIVETIMWPFVFCVACLYYFLKKSDKEGVDLLLQIQNKHKR
jgi:hypothetical protein